MQKIKQFHYFNILIFLTRSITAVVEQIQHNARDLGELQMKVETWNRQGLDEREISLRSKDEQLKSKCFSSYLKINKFLWYIENRPKIQNT